MAQRHVILGQAIGLVGGITSYVLLYQVPVNAEAGRKMYSTVVSGLFVCNGGADATFSVAVIPGSVNVLDAVAPLRLIHKAQAILANKNESNLLKGVTLSPNDHIRIAASTVNVSFSLFGQENFS